MKDEDMNEGLGCRHVDQEAVDIREIQGVEPIGFGNNALPLLYSLF